MSAPNGRIEATDKPTITPVPSLRDGFMVTGNAACKDGAPCGRHHETVPGRCCCGGDWPGTMICHPCRNPNHAADACVDGPPPAGGRYGSGRYCNCVHRPVSAAQQELGHGGQ